MNWMNKYTILIAAVTLGIAFQNCAKSSFTDAGGVLVEKTEGDDEAMTTFGVGEIPVVGEEGSSTEGGAPVATVPPVSGETESECSPQAGNASGNNGKGPTLASGPCTSEGGNAGGGNAGGNVSDGNSDDEKDRLYVCVLAGPGHSVKLGYLDKKLVGKVATPDHICMTAAACTDIVSQAFRVKMPAKRGFCPNKNPHVHHFSNAEMQALIDETKKGQQ